VLLGAVWYAAYARNRGVEEGLFDEAFGGLASGVWQTLPGTTAPAAAEPYRVVVGVANPETQRGLLRLAAATARAHAEDGPPELVAVNVIEAESTAERNVASERLSNQRALLENTRDIAAEMDVALRTVAVVGEDAGESLLEVVLEEDADQALVGWQGDLAGGVGESVFGSTLDSLVTRAPCDLSLVKMRDDAVGTPASLAGSGPHAPVAARQAADFAAITDAIPVLLNAQQPGADEETNHVKRGRETIQSVADQGGLADGAYEDAVVVGTDVESAILEAVRGYETVCVGLSERSDPSRAMLGSLAERVSQETTGNVCIVRSAGTVDRPAEKSVAE
jgi:APA family basic amino acid/polyamine antiporter